MPIRHCANCHEDEDVDFDDLEDPDFRLHRDYYGSYTCKNGMSPCGKCLPRTNPKLSEGHVAFLSDLLKSDSDITLTDACKKLWTQIHLGRLPDV